MEQLISFGRLRGYAHPELWARHVLKAREERKAAQERWRLEAREGRARTERRNGEFTEVDSQSEAECYHCHLKRLSEDFGPPEQLQILLQLRGIIRSKQADTETAIKQAKAERTCLVAQLLGRQPWWKKWLHSVPTDESLDTLVARILRLEQELRNLISESQHTKRGIESARRTRKQFDVASRNRALLSRHQGRVEETRDRFDASCRTISITIDRSKLNIRKQDYKRGNRLDNHFRNDIATNVMAAFENKCLHCGGNSDLTLDHFALPKNEGGNFVLWVKDDGTIRLNVVVLCRSCNSAKGELSHIDFFAPEKQSQAIACQGRLLEFVLASEPTLRVIKRWYRST